jgi:membrane peptidoglycan carboxypeptidase
MVRKRSGLVGMGLGAVFSLLLFAIVLVAGMVYADLSSGLPSLETLPLYFDPQSGAILQPTRLFDRTGKVLIAEIDNPGIPRQYLSIDPTAQFHLSPLLAQTVILLNDPTFWQSSGISTQSLSDPHPQTLAEKLALDILLEGETPGLRRAIRMRLLAAQLTARFGRAQVLEWYLNSAYFGHLAYGAESAAQLYLGKSAQDLTLSEALLLAAVARAPAVNPIDSPEGAADLQSQALRQLVESGQFSPDELDLARIDPSQFRPAPAENPSLAPAFSSLVIQDIEQRFGRQRIERGGLEIRTSLDVDLQQSLACVTHTQIERLTGASSQLPQDCPAARLLPTLPPGSPLYPVSLAGSGIILNAQTGEILALIGDTRLSGEDSALPRHQPGSLLSPFVALAAVSRGQSPASLVWDLPANLPENTNQNGKFYGPQRLRLAVANDYLAALNQLLRQFGAGNVWRLAEPLGLADLSESASPQSLLFGGGSYSLVDLAKSYAVFANLGTQTGRQDPVSGAINPTAIIFATDLSGRPLIAPQVTQKRALISAELAYLVHHILQDETARWPSLGQANPLEIGRPSAAKAGQADQNSEVWTAGYTPQRVVVTWLGLPQSEENAPALQPKFAAGLWYALIQESTRDLPADQWQQPAGINTRDVCNPSGLLPTVDCPSIVSEVFLTGSEPTELDSLYRRVQINRETNSLATVFTPLQLIEEQTYMVLPADAQDWARESGIPQPPTSYDVIQPPAPLPGVQVTAPNMFSFVRGQVSVAGSASGPGFGSYRLQAGQGLNPRSWVQIGETGSQPVENGLLAMWDTTSNPNGLYALRLVVTRQDNRVETAVLQVTVDNTPPSARINFPATNQVLSSTETVLLQASVEDNLGIKRVEWLLDGSLLAETSEAPFAFAWQPARGDHRLLVRVTDLAGNVSESEIVEFSVK